MDHRANRQMTNTGTLEKDKTEKVGCVRIT